MCIVNINGIRWIVRGCEKNAKVLQEDGDDVLGITCFAQSEIWIRVEDVSPDMIKRTIRHELTHAWLFSVGIDTDDMDEEDICNFVESFGEQIVNTTKDVFAKLGQEDFFETQSERHPIFS